MSYCILRKPLVIICFSYKCLNMTFKWHFDNIPAKCVKIFPYDCLHQTIVYLRRRNNLILSTRFDAFVILSFFPVNNSIFVELTSNNNMIYWRKLSNCHVVRKISYFDVLSSLLKHHHPPPNLITLALLINLTNLYKFIILSTRVSLQNHRIRHWLIEVRVNY